VTILCIIIFKCIENKETILEDEETLLTVDFLTDHPFLINFFNELSKSGLINYAFDAESRLSWSTQYEFSSGLLGGRMSISKS
jgi:hypothetical protein